MPRRLCICRRPRLHLASRRRPDPRHPVGSRRLAAERLDSRVGRRSPAAIPLRRFRCAQRVLERQHLSSRAADAGLLRASVRAGGADPSGLRADRKHRPLLQPAVSLDVRAVRPRHVSVRARSHRQPARRVRRRPDLRVRAVSRAAVRAPAGALVAVDAVCAVRICDDISSADGAVRAAPLAGAGAALVAQNLSNGYFLLFFAPFVVAYVLFEIATRSLWKRRARLDRDCSDGLRCRGCYDARFCLPYLELRNHGFPPAGAERSEVVTRPMSSATGRRRPNRVCGAARSARYPKPEGDLFPTFTALRSAASVLR